MLNLFDKKHSNANLPPAGGVALVNLGQTCYLNSSLQALASLQSLASILPDHKAASSSAPHSSPSLQALLSDAHPPELPVTAALAAVLGRMREEYKLGERRPLVNPKDLQKAIGRKNDAFADPDEQQDAHELLRLITDAAFMEELDLIKKLRPPAPTKPKRRKTRKAADQQSSAEDSSSSSSEDDSSSAYLIASPTASPSPGAEPQLRPFIDGLFGGKLASIIVCEECKHISVCREPFMDLSLPIVKEEKSRRRDRIRQLLGKSSSTSTTSSSEALKTAQSDTEGSDSDAGGAQLRNRQLDLDDDAKVKRRRSLDPSTLRRGRSPLGRARESSGEESERAAYIRKLLTPVPPVVPASSFSQLRIARPDQPGAVNRMPSPGPPGDAQEETNSSGLFDLLREFTNVEVLDGDNSLQCRKCWKIAHPDLVKARRLKRLQRSPRSRSDTIKPTKRPDPPAVSPDRRPQGLKLDVPEIQTTAPSPTASELELPGERVPPSPSQESIGSDTGAEADVEVDSVFSGGSMSGAEDLSLSRQTSVRSNGSASPKITFTEPVKHADPIPPKAERFILCRAHKRYLVDTLPKVLVLHLKRFQQSKSFLSMISPNSPTSSNFGTLKKIEDFVSFPATLEMASFLAPKLTAGATGVEPYSWMPPNAPRPSQSPLLKPNAHPKRPKSGERQHSWFHWLHHHRHADGTVPSTKYSLSAVVSHAGTIGGGHYVAYALHKSPHKEHHLPHHHHKPEELNWAHYSDETVRAASAQEVMSCKAYLVRGNGWACI